MSDIIPLHDATEPNSAAMAAALQPRDSPELLELLQAGRPRGLGSTRRALRFRPE